MIQFRGATVESIRSRRRAAPLRSKDLSTTPRSRSTAPFSSLVNAAMGGIAIGSVIGLVLSLPMIVVAIWMSR